MHLFNYVTVFLRLFQWIFCVAFRIYPSPLFRLQEFTAVFQFFSKAACQLRWTLRPASRRRLFPAGVRLMLTTTPPPTKQELSAAASLPLSDPEVAERSNGDFLVPPPVDIDIAQGGERPWRLLFRCASSPQKIQARFKFLSCRCRRLTSMSNLR